MADQGLERMKAMMEKRRAFRKEFGEVLNKGIPYFEDPTRYPLEELIPLSRMVNLFNHVETEEEKEKLKADFLAKLDALKPLPDAPERVYIWKEGNMPQETVYNENPDHMYDHEPDFKPYFLEMLVPEDVTPVGGIVMVAGGTHGVGTINECFETSQEFNALGYQCFILQCRPNMGPWCKKDGATDAARTFQIIRKNAAKYRLDPDHLAYAGYSNGGVTGDGCIEFYSENQKIKDHYPDYTEDEYDAFYGAPNAFLCVYGVRHVGTKLTRESFAYPPIFFAVGREDKTCMENLKDMLPWLWKNDVPVEIHTFSAHPHGYAGWKIIDGKGDKNYDLWIEHADVFLRDLFVGYDPDLHND